MQRLLDIGVSFVIIGTKAVNTPHFVRDLCIEYPRHVMVAIDARDGRVAVDGWAKLSHFGAVEMAQHCERDGVEAIIYTDIGRDGMMNGVNVESTREIAQAITTPVIASGGVSSLDDLRKLREVEEDGVIGCVIGRALYEGGLKFSECLKAVQ